MSFFCLLLFLGVVGECGFACCSLSPDLRSRPPLFSLIDTGIAIFVRFMYEFDFLADTLIGGRRAQCTRQSSLNSPGVALRSLPRSICSCRVNQMLLCHELSVACGGHCYAR